LPPARRVLYNIETASVVVAVRSDITLRNSHMFDNLSEKLQRVFKNMRGEGKLTAENMETALREIRVALLEADVHFRVVKQLIENVRQKAMGEEVLAALSPAQQVVKIVRDELIRILGTHQSKLRFANDPPSAIMIVGLQGRAKPPAQGSWRGTWRRTGTTRSSFPWTCTVRRPQAAECDRAGHQDSGLRGHGGRD
jgi:Signal recognition particle GTPase